LCNYAKWNNHGSILWNGCIRFIFYEMDTIYEYNINVGIFKFDQTFKELLVI